MKVVLWKDPFVYKMNKKMLRLPPDKMRLFRFFSIIAESSKGLQHLIYREPAI